MREYLRLDQVEADSESGGSLHQLDLSIYQGEILYVAGVHWSGKPALKGVLTGRSRIRQGRLWLHEQVLKAENYQQEQLIALDKDIHFCQTLTIQENLFSLRGFSLLSLNRIRERRREVEELLAWAHIDRTPSTRVSRLTDIEKTLLGFALARLRRTPLVILDMVGMSYSASDLQRIGLAAHLTREEDRSVLILDEHPSPLMEAADRIAILRRGSIQKILYGGPGQEETVRGLLAGTYQAEKENVVQPEAEADTEEGEAVIVLRGKDGSRRECFCRKQIIGFYDSDWSLGETMPQYLKNFERINEVTAEQQVPDSEVVYVPENSGDALFDSLDIGGNIALVAYRQFTREFGLLKNTMKEFLRIEFLEKFGLPDDLRLISELGCRDRKLLSIYRWALTHPSVMMLENPVLRISLQDRAMFEHYLRELAEEGTCLLVSSKDLADIQGWSDKLVIAEQKKNKRVLYHY